MKSTVVWKFVIGSKNVTQGDSYLYTDGWTHVLLKLNI